MSISVWHESKIRLNLWDTNYSWGEISSVWIPAISLASARQWSIRKLMNAKDNRLPKQFVVSGWYVEHRVPCAADLEVNDCLAHCFVPEQADLGFPLPCQCLLLQEVNCRCPLGNVCQVIWLRTFQSTRSVTLERRCRMYCKHENSSPVTHSDLCGDILMVNGAGEKKSPLIPKMSMISMKHLI